MLWLLGAPAKPLPHEHLFHFFLYSSRCTTVITAKKERNGMLFSQNSVGPAWFSWLNDDAMAYGLIFAEPPFNLLFTDMHCFMTAARAYPESQ
jgi:hypothetical protein